MKNFLLFVFLLVGQVSLAQRIGDYKSVASGDWSSLSTWQRWNGTAWVQPTSSEGYPGQNSVFYGAIVVEAGTVVSIDAIPSGFFTRPMATVTIKGRLVLSGPNNQAGIATFDTQLVDVVVGSGQIEFQNKVSLRINSSLVIGSAVFKVGLGGIIGDCSNNQDIQLGNNTGSDFVSICKGGGSANVTFDELMKAGGTPDVVINPVAPVCSGGTLNLSGAISGPTGTNGTFSWFLNDSSESFASGTTATIPAIAAGTYTIKLIYTATYSLGVYSNSETVTVIIPPTVATPTIGTVTNITCSSGTGSVVLNNLPSGSWMIKQSGALSTTYSGSGSTYTIVGLARGNYTFSVSSGGCTSSTTVNVPIADASSTTWNGSSWSNGVPDETKNAIITEVAPNSPFTSNLIACALTISTGVNATVASGVTIIITNAVTIKGQLIFENNASLVQVNPAAQNTGAIQYKRTSSPMVNFDFTYWSSPVTGQTAKNLSPNTFPDKYFKYNGKTGWVFDDGVMTPGVGFIIRVPKPGTTYPNGENWNTPSYAQPVVFSGMPNNGPISFAVGADEFNLVGNPYPSAVDATLFMEANSGIIYGPLYFWTHNTPIANNVYVSNDYATFNLVGGTATGLPTGSAINSGLNTNAPTGFIAAGQSFFVGTKVGIPPDSGFKFTNTMRVSGKNAQFFKQASTKKTVTNDKNRVWLNLTNRGGAFKQLLVGYLPGATNGWDNLYDGPSFNGQEFVDFYSTNLGQNLTIQGRALPFEMTDEVPLGYRSSMGGMFEIEIDARDGLLLNQEIWLQDKKKNILHNLTEGRYLFTAIIGVENDRFVLKYTDKSLGTGGNQLENKMLVVSVKNKKITITSVEEAIKQVQIFDLLGRKLYDKSKINARDYSIDALPSSQQPLIVKTFLVNGTINTQKIIF